LAERAEICVVPDACSGMHHGDVGYDITDPALTVSQRAILEFSPSWFNVPRETSRHIEGNESYSRLHPSATVAGSNVDWREGWVGPRTVLQSEAAAKL
jgi:hypothetical protein